MIFVFFVEYLLILFFDIVSLSSPRFHHFSPGFLWEPLTLDSTSDDRVVPALQFIYLSDPWLQYGKDCCSSTSIAFHFIDDIKMHEVQDFLYHCSTTFIDQWLANSMSTPEKPVARSKY
jgi:hypothetical protein